MAAISVIAAHFLSADARVDQRVPRKQLVENGAHRRRQAPGNDGIEDVAKMGTPMVAGLRVARHYNPREYLALSLNCCLDVKFASAATILEDGVIQILTR